MEVKSQDTTGHNWWWRMGMHDPDQVLPEHLRMIREAAGRTQRAVAEEMTLAGYKMHQTTIAKIEAGERPVTVGEAVALACIVGVSLTALIQHQTADPEKEAAREALMVAMAEQGRLEREVAGLQETAAATARRLEAAAAELREARARADALREQGRDGK
jgi:transcriptional regulator with XRE-family HTH domain